MHDPKARCPYCCRTHTNQTNAGKCRRVTEKQWVKADAKLKAERESNDVVTPLRVREQR